MLEKWRYFEEPLLRLQPPAATTTTKNKPKLIFISKTQYPNYFLSWKPKVIFKHIWKLPLSIPIHNVKLLQQPYGIFYSEISSTMNPYNLSLSADLHTTHGSTKPRNLGHRNSWPRHHYHHGNPHLHHHEPTKKFIPQSNQTHIKIWIQGNKQSIKLRKRNKIYFERFRISEAFLSSISSSINSVASLALITATKAQIATTPPQDLGLGLGIAGQDGGQQWPTRPSRREMWETERQTLRERETWEMDV